MTSKLSKQNKRLKKKAAKRNLFEIPKGPQDFQKSLFDDMANGPNIIPRPKHCISRKNIDKEALKVLYRLKDHGYLAYLVGGSVRDLLLGKRPKDFDIGTNATPEEIRRLFRFSRIIGKRFRLVHVYFKGGKIIEISTFRKQIELDDREAQREGLGPDGIFGTPMEDAFRRDLTINGLFYNISDFSIIDYVGGIDDLKAGVIRTIGDPERRFIRDPVRMMRAIRHASRTGFRIDEITWKAICKHAPKIKLCAIPRVRDEWLKDIKSGFSAHWIKYMLESSLFKEVFPGLWPFLENDEDQKVKRTLIAMMKEVDKVVINSEEEHSDAFFLAALSYPLLHFSKRWIALQPEKIRWPTHEIRMIFDEIFLPYDFKRADRDLTAQLLSSQWPISICASKGRWQKRVCNKVTFSEALTLYNCLKKALREPGIELSAIPQGRKTKKGNKKARKNGHRKKKHPRREV